MSRYEPVTNIFNTHEIMSETDEYNKEIEKYEVETIMLVENINNVHLIVLNDYKVDPPDIVTVVLYIEKEKGISLASSHSK